MMNMIPPSSSPEIFARKGGLWWKLPEWNVLHGYVLLIISISQEESKSTSVLLFNLVKSFYILGKINFNSMKTLSMFLPMWVLVYKPIIVRRKFPCVKLDLKFEIAIL